MLGPEVLDVTQFPAIRFESTTVEGTQLDGWTVRGQLTLHGQTQPVTVKVVFDHGHYRGSASLKQTDFGIIPISIAGGTVKVKDEVSIEFDIVTRSSPAPRHGHVAVDLRVHDVDWMASSVSEDLVEQIRELDRYSSRVT